LRGAFTVLAALAVVIGTTAALAAEKRTVRWVQSIYIDGKGDGLKHPEGVACRDDHFVVADTGNSRISPIRSRSSWIRRETSISWTEESVGSR